MHVKKNGLDLVLSLSLDGRFSHSRSEKLLVLCHFVDKEQGIFSMSACILHTVVHPTPSLSLTHTHSLQIHVLHEDWSDESVQLVTCCEIMDVNKVSIDSTLPYYCTIVSLSDQCSVVRRYDIFISLSLSPPPPPPFPLPRRPMTIMTYKESG